MIDEERSKADLIDELEELRRRVTRLEKEAIAQENSRADQSLSEPVSSNSYNYGTEEQLRQILDTVPVLISYVDTDQRYRYNNLAYETWFGHSRQEVYGKSIEEVLGAAAYREIRPRVEEVLSGQEVSYQGEVPYKDGGTRHISASYFPHYHASFEVLGFIALVRDVTQHHQAEEKLRQSELRYCEKTIRVEMYKSVSHTI